MKKVIAGLATAALLAGINPPITHALFGGGISGPLPVYNTDKSVDAATLATQINTAKQLEADLANLAQMDPATAAANMQYIYQTLNTLAELQQQMQSMVLDYSAFQDVWKALYGDYEDANGLTTEDYAYQAAQIAKATDQAIYEAMLAQGFGVAGAGNSAANLQNLLNASQSAQGALAAIQAGNQIAGKQVEMLMMLQQIIAQNNNAQLNYQKQKMEQDKAAERAAAKAYSGGPDRDNPPVGTGVIR